MSRVNLFQLVAIVLVGALVAGKAVHVLVVRRVNPVTIFSAKRGLPRALEALFVVGAGTFAFRVLCYVFGSDFLLFFPLDVVLLESPVANAVGAMLVVAALVMLFLAYRSIGMSWRIGIDEQAPGPLVMSGAYRWSRHPIYLGADLYVVGTFLMNGTVLFLLFATLGPVLLHLQTVVEERSLEQLHGAAYAEYKTRTGRYITPRSR